MTAAARRCDRCDMLPCQCPAVRRDDAARQLAATEKRTPDPRVPVVPAQFDGVCGLDCGLPIELGQPITRTIGGLWIHAVWTDHGNDLP